MLHLYAILPCLGIFISISYDNWFNLISRHEPRNQKMYLRTCGPSKDSDQPAHSRSLIWIFTMRIWDSQGCKVSSSGQRRLWSDCADSQADLSLRLAHMWKCTFAHVAAQMAFHMTPDSVLTSWYCYQKADGRLLAGNWICWNLRRV